MAQDFEQWRQLARRALASGLPPSEIRFRDADDQPALAADPLPAALAPPPHVPKAFVELARAVALHRDPSRWNLLYRALYRIANGERDLLDFEADADVRAMRRMETAVRHEIHRVHAFVRFRRVAGDSGERFIAWFEPEHDVIPAAAPFFAKRFPDMRWSILTPRISAHWDGSRLEFGPGTPRAAAPAGDELEDFWRDYYASIFNPARLSIGTMRSQMPARYWHAMPETTLLPSLINEAEGRVNTMQRNQPASAQPFVPSGGSLAVLAQAARGCEGCGLYRNATQTVFGEGPSKARIMMVGEQPGDLEDLSGRPFIGPAGQLLDRALADAQVDRSRVYVTNAVKHFKFEPRGKRRIHSKPTGIEINACFPWLEAELAALKPELVVCLGATAAQALLGRAFRVTQERGVILPFPKGKHIMATIHPSALLRMPERREAEYARFVDDLRLIRSY